MGNLLCKDSPRRVYVKSPANGNKTKSYSVYEQQVRNFYQISNDHYSFETNCQQIHPNSLTRDDAMSPKRFDNTKSNL